jgi:hypothetical protein
MRTGIIILIMSISLLPRIPIDIAIPGRQLDLRFDDIALLVLILGWVFSFLLKPRIYPTTLFKVIGIYLLIVIITTSIALAVHELSLIKSFFYTLKEIQYFLIFFVVANWIRSEKDLKLASGFLLFASLLNVIWVVFQLGTSTRGPLFLVERTFTSVDQQVRLLESYGPNLIGEASPLSTGGFFMLTSLLTISFYLYYRANNRRWLYAVLGVLFSSSLMLSFSRVAMLGLIIGIVVLLKNKLNLKIIIKTILSLTIILIMLVLMMDQLEYLSNGRLSYAGASHSIIVRWQDIWLPLFHQQSVGSFFLGFGKGALVHEAHNHYLRVFMESGLFGLIAFIGLLASVIFLSDRVFKFGNLAISKVIGGTTLAATAALIIAALFQDVFTPVIINELFWILVGLTAAAYRIEYKEFLTQSQLRRNSSHIDSQPFASIKTTKSKRFL